MEQLTISQVAQPIGIQTSAIRYYEPIGLLPPALRLSGQRRYDSTMLYRLAIVQRARQLGFSITGSPVVQGPGGYPIAVYADRFSGH